MPKKQKKFASVDEAIDAIARGNVVIVVDDEDRENEGDFICAAEKVTPDIVNFMVKHGGGELCVPLLPERARELDLEALTQRNTALHRTAFTMSVDLRTLSTGVSAFERAETIRALASPETRPGDLARPGHIHPLIAQEGGVLRRAGHTEAAMDLARLAGLTPVGVLIEILDDDGRMARRDRLVEIAAVHDLPIITIEELIRHRRRTEKLVTRVASTKVPTKYGQFVVHGYEVRHEDQQPIALVMGDLAAADAPLVRMHSSCFTGDVLESLRCECGAQLHMALERISNEGVGALVYLPQEGRGIGILAKLKAYELQDKGRDTVEANIELGFRADMRDYGIGIQVLKDLGLSRVRLLTNNPKKSSSFVLYGYDLELVAQEPIVAPVNSHNQQYLQTKREKLGHDLPLDEGR